MIVLRRLLYLLYCAAAFFYYIFHTGYLSWILLSMAVSLPFLSIAITLLLRRGLRVLMQANSAGDGILSLSLAVAPALPYTTVRLRLRLENLFTQEETFQEISAARAGLRENRIEVPLEGGCGVIRCTVKSAHMLDLLGLFFLPLPKPGPLEFLSLPKEIPFSGEDLDAAGQTAEPSPQQNAAGLAGERELRDIRDYRPGDSLRDVHWKLTARFDRPIVREYGYFADAVRTAAILWAGQPEKLAPALSRLLGVVRCLSGRGPYLIFWFEAGRTQKLVSPDAEALHALFWNALSKPPAARLHGPAPFTEFGLKERFLLADSDAVLLCEEGTDGEVVS